MESEIKALVGLKNIVKIRMSNRQIPKQSLVLLRANARHSQSYYIVAKLI